MQLTLRDAIPPEKSQNRSSYISPLPLCRRTLLAGMGMVLRKQGHQVRRPGWLCRKDRKRRSPCQDPSLGSHPDKQGRGDWERRRVIFWFVKLARDSYEATLRRKGGALTGREGRLGRHSPEPGLREGG